MTDSYSGADFATCPKCDNSYFRDAPWKKVCLKCYLKTKGQTYTPPPAAYPVTAPAIELDMLRRLIQLCHPDKHNGSEAANTATRFLLALKGAQHG